MKFLLDTNIFIPLEPTASSELESTSPDAAALLRSLMKGDHDVFLHEASKKDIDRDKNRVRADLRRHLFNKYPILPDPPQIGAELLAELGAVEYGSNNWVDHMLLASIAANAVDYLVSEDQRLVRKARRLKLEDRVFSISGALANIRALAGTEIVPPPAVQVVKPHALSLRDPIFESLREDYPGFDVWFAKCCREHRQTWKIDGGEGKLAGLCIVKAEDAGEHGLEGRFLKVCCFKISRRHVGLRYGELLLKIVFDHAQEGGFCGIYVTVLEKQEQLIDLLQDFGFLVRQESTTLGELVMAKRLAPGKEDADVSRLEFNKRYGPFLFDPDVAWFLVPIQPRYSDILFPETAEIRDLFAGQLAFGNAIRKAYLCHAGTRRIQEGDMLVFYRTQRAQGIVALGVVERTVVSDDPSDIARAVSRRTVYPMADIIRLCEKDVLALLFRQARILRKPIPSARLLEQGVFAAPPQSIMQIRKEGKEWLKAQVQA